MENLNEVPRMYRVTIETPDGLFFAGSAPSYAAALDAAENQLGLSKLPRKGPGMWEMNKKP